MLLKSLIITMLERILPNIFEVTVRYTVSDLEKHRFFWEMRPLDTGYKTIYQ